MGNGKGLEDKKVRQIYLISWSAEAYRRLIKTLEGFDIMGVRASKLNRLIGTGRVKWFRVPTSTPKGYVPVSVGVNDDTRRFIVHTTTLRDADFLEMLCKSAEEYGFHGEGILRIPCNAKDFEEWIMTRAKRKIVRVRVH
ncbi:auxin-induced protein 6B-like [Durio zibethinus]|uniref:Auxin-induced protein 6B-like n=1 Tax=Durio zibethinus TaxID=66656 RepID=A0A6P5WY43_DURZI|nr:auxin-induced protein 6B-like [Durio zibethinus]